MTKRRRRKRRWKAPNNPTVQARQVWRAVYGDPWPKGWRVKWVGFMRGALGVTDYAAKTIRLSHGDFKRRDVQLSVIETLIHEFTHVRNKGLRHGQDFRRLVKWGLAKLDLTSIHEFHNRTRALPAWGGTAKAAEPPPEEGI